MLLSDYSLPHLAISSFSCSSCGRLRCCSCRVLCCAVLVVCLCVRPVSLLTFFFLHRDGEPATPSELDGCDAEWYMYMPAGSPGASTAGLTRLVPNP